MVHRLPRSKTARVIFVFFIILSLTLMAWHFFGHPKKAGCVGLCQCNYCDPDYIIDGQCYRAVGCVGACNGCPNCNGQPGLGGCGSWILWCRGSDCCGKPTPRPRPTATPRPPADCHGEWKVIKHPSVTSWKYTPPFPVVIGQDAIHGGFTLDIYARGGWAELWHKYPKKHCDDGSCKHWHWVCKQQVLRHYDDPLVKIDLTMDLAQSSREWIYGDLRARYPGAHVKEKLPWEAPLWSGRANSVHTQLKKYPSEDPGKHVGDIILETAGTPLNPPQHLEVPYMVPVHLIDTELVR